MNAKTQKPISEMTTAEMVAEYNKLTDKSIKKFSSRAAGEKQLAKAREFMVVAKAVVAGAASVKEDERKGDRRDGDRRHEPAKVVVTKPAAAPAKSYDYAVDGCPNCKATEDQTAAGLEGTKAGLEGTKAGDERNFCHHCGTEYWRDTGKIYKAPKVSTTRSKGISESWNNPEVAAKRAQRHNVKVVLDGKDMGVFRSTLEAFKKLHLPQSSHIKFRMALKAAGKKEFQDGKKTYQFILVEQKELPLK